jgi:hypothetical protein
MLLLRAGDTLTGNAARRLAEVFAADAAAAKEELKILVDAAGRPETNKLYRTVCRWWNEIEVLIVTGATTGKVEANNTGIKHIKNEPPPATATRQLQIGCRPHGGMTLIRETISPRTLQRFPNACQAIFGSGRKAG